MRQHFIEKRKRKMNREEYKAYCPHPDFAPIFRLVC